MSGNFAIKGGGVRRLMANTILNFHFDFPHPSLSICKNNYVQPPQPKEQGNVNLLSPRIEDIHQMSVGISGGVLALVLVLVVLYILVKTGLVS